MSLLVEFRLHFVARGEFVCFGLVCGEWAQLQLQMQPKQERIPLADAAGGCKFCRKFDATGRRRLEWRFCSSSHRPLQFPSVAADRRCRANGSGKKALLSAGLDWNGLG